VFQSQKENRNHQWWAGSCQGWKPSYQEIGQTVPRLRFRNPPTKNQVYHLPNTSKSSTVRTLKVSGPTNNLTFSWHCWPVLRRPPSIHYWPIKPTELTFKGSQLLSPSSAFSKLCLEPKNKSGQWSRERPSAGSSSKMGMRIWPARLMMHSKVRRGLLADMLMESKTNKPWFPSPPNVEYLTKNKASFWKYYKLNH